MLLHCTGTSENCGVWNVSLGGVDSQDSQLPARLEGLPGNEVSRGPLCGSTEGEDGVGPDGE